MVKEFKNSKTYYEQLQIMTERGLIVSDEEFAIAILQRVNYYKLAGFSLHLKCGERYMPNTEFEQIYNTYLFNKRLSILLFDLIESIENHFKTSFANYLSLKYGATPHLDENLYKNLSLFYDFEKRYRSELKLNSKVKFIQHNINKYGELPIWVAIEILSFGNISKLYKNLKNEKDKIEISEVYFTQNNAKIKPYYLENWLEATIGLRNRCAHHTRLYNRTIPVTVKLHKTYLNGDKVLSTEQVDENSLFAVFVIMNRMVAKRSHWSSAMLELTVLFEQYADVVELEKMGFPENWVEYFI